MNGLTPNFDAAALQTLTEPWHWILVALVAAALVALVFWLYRRDSIELGPGYGWFLLSLRLAALVALAAYFLRYEKRVDQLQVYESRVAVLVDTSLSMARTDPTPSGSAGTKTRIAQIADELAAGKLVDRLRDRHQVHLYRFDQSPKPEPIVSLPKNTTAPVTASASEPPSDDQLSLEAIRDAVPHELWWALGITAVVSVALCIVWLVAARGRVTIWQSLFALAGSLTPTIPVIALIALVIHQRNVLEESPTGAAQPAPSTAPSAEAQSWQARLREKLVAKGTETRLGQALDAALADEQSSPTAAVIVFTEGGQNAGVEPAAVLKETKQAKIPVFPVGVGSSERQANVRIADLAAPARVFPDDSFDITAFVQATGLIGRTVTVELLSLPADAENKKANPPGAATSALEKREATERVKLAADGEAVPVKFVMPPGKPGRRTYVVRVESLPEDHEPKDNDAQASVDVVERKLRVLLLAGGPSREYQYLRNMLHRDRNVSVDVLLQIAKPGPGISQDADQILADLPATKADWGNYDVLVALDPDWRAFPAEAIESLEEWVGSDSGGLIVAAGPVYTGVWTGDPKGGSHLAKIRALYPVTFPRHGLVLATDAEKFRSTSPWPVELSRPGVEAPFLRLDDVPAASQRAWNLFPGVFGYYPVTGVKPGATVYARYGTPDVVGEKPVYLAGHFYGSGRVFYMGGGEMWRLRGVDEAYFEMFYTRLLRYVSEGRLLRGNKRGSLLVDRRRYVVGDAIEVQAMLADARREPLVLPRVPLAVITPSGESKTVELAPHASRKGLYHGDFLPTEQGTYRLELETPGSPYELLTETIRVLQPDLEQEHSRRDDALLSAIADATGGKYYPDLASIHGAPGRAPLADEISDATRIVRVRGMPSESWDERWARVLLGVIAALLFTEWTMRRLARLA